MTDEPQLHDLTKLLLDRMKTYPEEFVQPSGDPVIHGKWLGVFDRALQWGAPQDKEALNCAFAAIVMDKSFQQALKVLLVPEESADSAVGQNSTVVSSISALGGGYGVQGAAVGNGGPSLTQQQAQAIMKAQRAQRAQAQRAQAQQAQQTNSVTISADVARAMGLKPSTAKETFVEAYEQIKKRLGL